MNPLLVFVVGTRAQLIKVAPVVVACEERGLSCVLVMTGQHAETMDDLLNEFPIRSRYIHALGQGEHSSIGALLGWLPRAYVQLHKTISKLAESTPDCRVLTHGDTLSTLIGTFAAKRCGLPVIHLESGLSSGAWFDPFPEELVRRLVFRMTDIAMCPNPEATRHMCRYQQVRAFDIGGNSIADAVRQTGALDIRGPAKPFYVVASLHRFQNIYNRERLAYLVKSIEALSDHCEVHFVLHPATRGRLQRKGFLAQLEAHPNIHLRPRMGYGEFLRLAAGATCVLTDGGSNQEELALLGVPTIIMRPRTERPDGLGVTAIMESELSGKIEEFISTGTHERLRRPSTCPTEIGPSKRIAEYLAREMPGGVSWRSS